MTKLTIIASLVALGAMGFAGSASASDCQTGAGYSICLPDSGSSGGSGSCTWSSSYNYPTFVDLGQYPDAYGGTGAYQSSYSETCPGSTYDSARTGAYAYSNAGSASFGQSDSDWGSGHYSATGLFVNTEHVAFYAAQSDQANGASTRTTTGVNYYTPVGNGYIGTQSYSGDCHVYVGSSDMGSCPAEPAYLAPGVPSFPVLP